MGYTVVSMTDEDGAQGSGLTLPEAFARMMAFARCDYMFGRREGDMYLSIVRSDDAADASEMDPPPALRSKLLDDAKARAEIMRRFVRHAVSGYCIMTDEDWHREERMRCDREGSRPVRRIDNE